MESVQCIKFLLYQHELTLFASHLICAFWHSDENGSISHVNLLLSGQDPYKDFFVADENRGGVKMLDPKYHRRNRSFLVGPDIHLTALANKYSGNQEPITGRALYDQANMCLLDVKKAIEFVQEHLDHDGYPKEPGDTVGKIIERLLDYMWLDGQDKDDDKESSTDDHSEKNTEVEEMKKRKQKLIHHKLQMIMTAMMTIRLFWLLPLLLPGPRSGLSKASWPSCSLVLLQKTRKQGDPLIS